MDPAEDLVRRLALNDEKALSMVLTRRAGGDLGVALNPKVEALVQLATLLAAGATPPLLRETIARAASEGATEREIVGVLVAAGPVVGLAGLVSCALRLAVAIGYDLENGHGMEGDERPGRQGGA